MTYTPFFNLKDMTQQEKEIMFLYFNDVLVKFWIEQGRPDKDVRIELLERMLNWYKKMGTITLDKQSKEPVNEDLEAEIDSFWNKASGFSPKFTTLEVKENGFAVIARHFANWQKEQMLRDAVEGTVIESFYPVSSRPEHGITLIYEDEGKPYWLPGDHFKFIPIKED